eukprot:244260_1
MADRIRLDFSGVSQQFSGSFNNAFEQSGRITVSDFRAELNEINAIIRRHGSAFYGNCPIVCSAICSVLGSAPAIMLWNQIKPDRQESARESGRTLVIFNLHSWLYSVPWLPLVLLAGGVSACTGFSVMRFLSTRKGLQAVNEYMAKCNNKYVKHGAKFSMDMDTRSISIEMVDIEMQDMSIQPVHQNITMQPVNQNVIMQPVHQNMIMQPVPQNVIMQQVPQNAVMQQVPQNAIMQPVPQNMIMQPVPQNAIMQQVQQNAIMQQVPQNMIMQQVPQNAMPPPYAPQSGMPQQQVMQAAMPAHVYQAPSAPM